MTFKVSLFKSVGFPTYYNFSFLWNFGFILTILFLIQIFSGIVISFFINFSFKQVLFCKFLILNYVCFGWFFLKLHCILPSFLFFFIYLHIFKNMINFTFSPINLFISGFILYFFFIFISFTGYSLAGGAMGYWAVVVVYNIFKYLLGFLIPSCLFFHDGIGINDLTILKLFSFHYIFSLLGLTVLLSHIFFLHNCGSSNSLHPTYCDNFRFSYFMFFKDCFLLLVFSIFFIFLIFLSPSIYFMLGDNFLEVNEFKSLDICVEWYLRIFFIILRATNSKFFGVLFTLIFILVLFCDSFNRNLFRFKIISSSLYFFILVFIFSVIIFSWFYFSSYLFSVSFILVFILFLFVNLLYFFLLSYPNLLEKL